MNNKIIVTILTDIILLGIIVLSVYFIITRTDVEWINNLCTGIIFVSIPIIFYISYMTFAYDKFEYDEKAFEYDEMDKEEFADEGANEFVPIIREEKKDEKM